MNKLLMHLYAVETFNPNESDEAEVFSQLVENIVYFLLWGFGIVGVIFCIQIGFKFAMAKTPEDKKAAKDRLIWFVIGTAIIFFAATIWTFIKAFLGK